MTVTKAQHDAVVEARQRPYTDKGMRAVRDIDHIAPDLAGLTILDTYVSHSRKARRDA